MSAVRALLQQLLPDGIATAECRPDWPLTLFAEEKQAVERAVEKRRREFAGGRACARAALAELGAPAAPLLPDGDRVPSWPAGFVGSISHCADCCLAAVARSDQIVAIGIDVEQRRPLGARERELVCTERERELLGDPDLTIALFAAKESFYKALFPRVRRLIDFHAVELRLDLPRRRFDVIAAHEPAYRDWAARAEGSLALTDSHAVATCVVRHP
jgi:4'-phosphopantetheinyl transferase EntD